MANKIGLIAEDVSDVDVIKSILGKLLDENSFSTKKFVGNGCGKLRNKCDVWTENLFKNGCSHVLIFHDLDQHNERSLRTLLEGKVCQVKYPHSIIVIPVKEIEAWLMADVCAIQKVFKLPKPPRIRHNCETIDRPKEYLERAIWTAGKKRYLHTVHNKRIADIASLSKLKGCKSFRLFSEYVERNVK